MTDASYACVLCYHKQKTSARTRFLLFVDSVLLFGPLPANAVVRTAAGPVRPHPVPSIRSAESWLRLPAGSLRPEPEFQVEVDTPDGWMPVLLAEFTALDPPFEAAAAVNGRFVAITEARDLPPLELELLRRAYETILG